MDGAFGGVEALQFVFEGLNHRGPREQTAVIGKGGKPDEHAFVLEGGNAVADRLGGFARHGGANRGAHLV